MDWKILEKPESYLPAIVILALALKAGWVSAGSNCPTWLAGGAGADVTTS
jgi:hypothetical protein